MGSERWYENAVIYAIDVKAFQDSNGDGIGDFRGLTDRLDYLDALGVDCLWLLPFYPTPGRDNGYDVRDYYGVDPRLGTLGDFADFVRAAEERGIRVVVDLVVNHTSKEHPWFRAAREDPDSPYRDYYVWSEEVPDPDPSKGSVFPGEAGGDRVWTYDEVADAYYFHRFYDFQPDLDLTNPAVREEIRKIMGFWLQLGVSGFRIDAATLMIQGKRPGVAVPDDPHQILRDLRAHAVSYREDAVLIAEADDEPSELAEYFGDGDEMDLLLNFVLDAYLTLALAEERAAPIEECLDLLPEVPPGGQWANFLRNYDELNVGRLDEADRRTVFERFAPDEDMRIYGRGIRRRLAPILEGDRDRIELAFSLLFSMPGTPLFVYGDEIGMGEDLSLPGREAVRTPMQWSDAPNGGFSTAAPSSLIRPVVDEGEFGYERVNVADQWDDPESLLGFVRRLIGTRKTCPEVGTADPIVLETGAESVFAHRYDADGETVVLVHNLGSEPRSVRIELGEERSPVGLLGDAAVEDRGGTWTVDLPRYDYRWLRAARRSG